MEWIKIDQECFGFTWGKAPSRLFMWKKFLSARAIRKNLRKICFPCRASNFNVLSLKLLPCWKKEKGFSVFSAIFLQFSFFGKIRKRPIGWKYLKKFSSSLGFQFLKTLVAVNIRIPCRHLLYLCSSWLVSDVQRLLRNQQEGKRKKPKGERFHF